MRHRLAPPLRTALTRSTVARIVTSTLAILQAVSGVACSRTAEIALNVVEPCDQKGQALAGVRSYMVASRGSGGPTPASSATFKPDEGAPKLDVGLMADDSDGIVVTVQAFEDDVTLSNPTPEMVKALGGTVPVRLDETTPDLDVLVPVGLVDSFGRTTDAQGECTSMSTGGAVPGRHGHTATYVPLLGKVLIYGGAVFSSDGTESILTSAELWDPATGVFEPLEAKVGRAFHAATALPDGRVFISGGLAVIQGELATLATADIFDPATLEFTQAILKQPRAHHTSSFLESAGLVVLAGGCTGNESASGCATDKAGTGSRGDSTALQFTMEVLDIRDVAAGTAIVPAESALSAGRAFHTATVLDSEGSSLLVIAGGLNGNGVVGDIELFRGQSGTLTKVDDERLNLASFPFGRAPAGHAAVAVSDNQILFIGGQTAQSGGAPSGAVTSDVWSFTTSAGVNPQPAQYQQGALAVGRARHTAAVVRKSRESTGWAVLVVGGTASAAGGQSPTSQILEQVGPGLSVRAVDPPLLESLVGSALTELPNGQLLLTGGHTSAAPFTTRAEAHLFFPRPF